MDPKEDGKMSLTDEEMQRAWAKWNEENDFHCHQATYEQVIDWLEGLRAWEVELRKTNPERLKDFEAERFAYLKYWQKEIAAKK